MNYTEIMKWFPKFLPAKNSMVPDYCKYIAFCQKYTAVTNGCCLVVDKYTGTPSNSEFEGSADKTLRSFKPYITKQIDYETIKYWGKQMGCLADVVYIQLGESIDLFQSYNSRDIHIRMGCSQPTDKVIGGLFSGKMLTKILEMLYRTSPSTERFTVELSNENRPLLRMYNTSTTVILAGLRPVQSIRDSGIGEWLRQCNVNNPDL